MRRSSASGIETLKTFANFEDTLPVGVTVSGSQLFGMVETLAVPDRGSAVFRLSPLDKTYERIYSFESNVRELAGLLSVSGSTLFGTITHGVSDPTATLFKLNSDGSGYQALHNFVLPIVSELGGPIVNGDYVYGIITTPASPTAPTTLYRVRTDGSAFETIRTFNNVAAEGYFASDFLVTGSTIYGAIDGGYSTQLGDVSGSIYKMSVDGSGFEVLRAFPGGGGAISLVLDDTTLYGVAHSGSPSRAPAIFQMNTDGTGYQVLHDFAHDPNPFPGTVTLTLVDGQLYGTTSHGGQNNMGTIFVIPEPSSILLALLGLAFAGAPCLMKLRHTSA